MSISLNEMQPTQENNESGHESSMIGKIFTSMTCSSSLESEIERKICIKHQLRDKLNQAELTIEQLEKMIVTTASHTNQVVNEYENVDREYAKMLKENRLQDEYICRETGILEAELESLKAMLETCNKRLKKINDKNSTLQNEILGNRYKIFCMHFNGLDEEQVVESDYNSTSVETSIMESTISCDSIDQSNLVPDDDKIIE